MAHSPNSTEKLISQLLDIIESREELQDYLKYFNNHIISTFTECLEECFNYKKQLGPETMLKIDSIIDFIDDEINIGHWSEISLELRRGYTLASFIKAILHLKYHKTDIKVEILREVLKYLDKGLLMGAPFDINSELLTKAATKISLHIKTNFSENTLPFNENPLPSSDNKLPPHENPLPSSENAGDNNNFNQYEFLYKSIKAQEVETLFLPPLQQFNRLFFKPQRPVKLKGCIDHWPARKKWKSLKYLLEICGDRTVPVEIGRQYVDENWSQKLMTVREFIKEYYSKDKGDNVGYLAQHNLFDQIPELREDICIPEYCCLSQDYDKSCDPDINCWFGPSGTVSSLHYDPKNNFLVQVYGTKQILLFAPEDTQYLYPFEGTMLSNTSQVDPLIPNLELFPNFPNSTMYKCLLKEGEMIFIPEKWWHHVVALDKSFSVSFWWQ